MIRRSLFELVLITLWCSEHMLTTYFHTALVVKNILLFTDHNPLLVVRREATRFLRYQQSTYHLRTLLSSNYTAGTKPPSTSTPSRTREEDGDVQPEKA